MNTIITIGAIAAFGAMIAGCDSPKPIAQVKKDVATAQAERSTNVAEARREGTEEVNAQRRDVTAAKDQRSYDVAVAKADGDYKVAMEACQVLGGSAQTDCKDRAGVSLKSDKDSAQGLKP